MTAHPEFSVTGSEDDSVTVRQCPEYGIWYLGCDELWCSAVLAHIDFATADDAARAASAHLLHHRRIADDALDAALDAA